MRGAFATHPCVRGEPVAVEFLYNAEEQIIGLRKIDPIEEHAYPIRGVKTDGLSVDRLGHGVHQVLRHRHRSVAAVRRDVRERHAAHRLEVRRDGRYKQPQSHQEERLRR